MWDANGNMIARQDFTPFGEPVLQQGTAIPKEGFGGNETDAETNQDYFHARMFEARTGRFTRLDPIFDGLMDPQRWNRYTYALNNPVTFVDPSCNQPPPKCDPTRPNDCNPSIPKAWWHGFLAGTKGTLAALTSGDSCVQDFLEGAASEFAPTPAHVDGPPEAATATLANWQARRAFMYSASRGLTVPLRSAVYRNMLKTGAMISEYGDTVGLEAWAILAGLHEEFNSASSGGCR